jgi:hypothetical protein
MKVRCIANRHNEDTRDQLLPRGIRVNGSREFAASLVVGREYLVVMLCFLYGVPPADVGPYVVIVPEVGYLLELPLALFEVSDPQVSRTWRLQELVDPDEGITEITLAPPSLLGNLNNYMEQLEHGDPAIVADFVSLIDRLRAEDAS